MRITLVGRSGKMGQVLEALIEDDPDLKLVEEDCDVVIDFSSPKGTKKALSMKKPLVCGTTGLNDEIFANMQELAKKIPILYSPNFSLGIALCSMMLEKVGPYLKKFASIGIEEVHHMEKKDSLSGTALKLAQILGIDSAAIKAKRIPNVVGIHQINFTLDNEMVSLRHEAFSREAFAKGAIEAAKFIFNKPAKFYEIRDLFY